MGKEGGTVNLDNGILFGYEKEYRHAAIWINHGNLKLSERDQSKMSIYCLIPLM